MGFCKLFQSPAIEYRGLPFIVNFFKFHMDWFGFVFLNCDVP
jgi:hypothetical protein